MPRYFLSEGSIRGGEVTLSGPTAHHIATSRRARAGDELDVVDASGRAHRIRLLRVSDREISASILESRPAEGESALDVAVVQALIKDGMDEAVDFMVATGVSQIVPATTERAMVHLDAARASRRIEHWQEVARQSAQIAYRGRIPNIAPIGDLENALSQLDGAAERRILACAMSEGAGPLAEATFRAGEKIALVIGPEGGLSPRDLDTLRNHDAEVVHLGPRVLRARFAAGFATTMCMSRCDALNVRPAALTE